jgi:purine-binding chemotaxis protein CheW
MEENQKVGQQPDIEREIRLQADQDQFLTFILGEETYGIDILRVQEIRGWEKPTKLPNMPNYVKGVINMRGAVVPIIDMRERFSISKPTYDESTVVIIVHVNYRAEGAEHEIEKTIGLVVDGVSDVHDVNLEQLQHAPSFGEGKRVSEEFVKGLATLDEIMVIILNIDLLANQGIFQEVKNHPRYQ